MLFRSRTRADMGRGCTEKLDREFAWWVLFEGRDKKRQAEYQAVMEKYGEKVTVIRNQRRLNEVYKNGFC